MHGTNMKISPFYFHRFTGGFWSSVTRVERGTIMTRQGARRIKTLGSSSGLSQGFSFSAVPFDPGKHRLIYVPESLSQEARQSERETYKSPVWQKLGKQSILPHLLTSVSGCSVNKQAEATFTFAHCSPISRWPMFFAAFALLFDK